MGCFLDLDFISEKPRRRVFDCFILEQISYNKSVLTAKKQAILKDLETFSFKTDYDKVLHSARYFIFSILLLNRIKKV